MSPTFINGVVCGSASHPPVFFCVCVGFPTAAEKNDNFTVVLYCNLVDFKV